MTLSLPSIADPKLDAGRQQGAREGQERGGQDGRRAGENDGYNDGRNRAAQVFAERARQDGARQGSIAGDQAGRADASQNGARDGQNKGIEEGSADGHQRADRDALASVTAQATQQGKDRAAHSDAPRIGQTQGQVDGRNQAAETAGTVDLQKGRDSYKAGRYAEPTKGTATRRQGRVQPPTASLWQRIVLAALSFATAPNTNADHRYMSLDSKDAGYRAEFQRAYDDGFRSAYQQNWQRSYDEAYRHSERRGARDAENQSYQGDFQGAVALAQKASYDQAYNSIYPQAYQQTYQTYFRQNSDRVYSQEFPRLQQQHFDQISHQVYQDEYARLRDFSYGKAKEATYAATYPALAKKQFNAGRVLEKAEMERLPVRLIRWTCEPSDVTDVFNTTVTLRNFAATPFPGAQVRLRVTTPGTADWLSSDTLLLEQVAPKSVALIEGALRFSSKAGAPAAILELSCKTAKGWEVVGTTPLVPK